MDFHFNVQADRDLFVDSCMSEANLDMICDSKSKNGKFNNSCQKLCMAD